MKITFGESELTELTKKGLEAEKEILQQSEPQIV